jgi:5-methylcytosine-specific restriction enzyme B
MQALYTLKQINTYTPMIANSLAMSSVVEEHGCELSQKGFRELVSTFIEHATEEALPLVPGHSYFLGRDEGRARTNLKTSLVPLLTEYLAQGYVSGFADPIRAYLQWLESL